MKDLGWAIRSLRRNPLFSLMVVATLGLGIGSNAAVFTLFDQVLLRALPVREPERLVMLDQPGANQGFILGERCFSYPMYREIRDQNEVFESVLARFAVPVSLTVNGLAERAAGVLVSGNYFQTLGIAPAVGRLLSPSDDLTPGAHPVVVLSHHYWSSRFGADPSAVGRDIRVNGQAMTIVGVAQAGFRGIELGSAPDVFVPLMMKKTLTPTWGGLNHPRVLWLNLLARLKSGVTVERAEAGANPLYHQILEREIEEMPGMSSVFREAFLGKRLLLRPGAAGYSSLRTQFGAPLRVLMVLVGLVLLIVCVNVSSLILARGTSRRRETAIRLALGATRWRILRQLVFETLLLVLAGTGVALLSSGTAVRLLFQALPSEGGVRSLSTSPDLRVLGFSALLALVSTLVALAPAFGLLQPNVSGDLKEGTKGATGTRRQVRFRKWMVAAQLALALVLLVNAALLTRSLANLESVDPGFQVDHLLVFSIDPSLSGYDPGRTRQLVERLQERLAGLPGVRHASVAEVSPLTDQDWVSTITVEGYHPREDENMNPSVNSVGPDYFTTLGIPILRGREFLPSDSAGAPKVVIVDQQMARYFFGKDDPIGRRIGTGSEAPDLEIVGVVGNGRFQNLRADSRRNLYFPYFQSEQSGETTLLVRGTAPEGELSGRVRDLLREIDPNLPIYNLKTMRVQLEDSLAPERLASGLSAAFGVLATLLAALGVYGAMALLVVRRKREIGIRMAVGAGRAQVLRLMLGETVAVTTAGLAAGLVLSALSIRFLQAQLFGLSSMDPLSIGLAVTILTGSAVAAGYIPARRAAGLDPVGALRDE